MLHHRQPRATPPTATLVVALLAVVVLLLLLNAYTPDPTITVVALPTAQVPRPTQPQVVVARADLRLRPRATPPLPTALPPTAIVPTVTPPLSTATATPERLPVLLLPNPVPAARLTTTPPAAPPDVFAAGRVPPILMYHYVRNVDPSLDPLGYQLSVAPDQFAAQMAWLSANQYTTVRMEQVARCLRGQEPCPPRAVALTFDDGYADAYSQVLPVLQRYGFTATFYIISGFVGHSGYMSWDQIAALRDAGMEIGAHTVDHLNLTDLSLGEVARQMTQSRAALEQQLGVTVTSFCYPAGLYNSAIEEQAQLAGFTTATTTRWDSDWSDLFGLPRRRIAGEVGIDSFVWIVQS